jgi:hypothetical protein
MGKAALATVGLDAWHEEWSKALSAEEQRTIDVAKAGQASLRAGMKADQILLERQRKEFLKLMAPSMAMMNLGLGMAPGAAMGGAMTNRKDMAMRAAMAGLGVGMTGITGGGGAFQRSQQQKQFRETRERLGRGTLGDIGRALPGAGRGFDLGTIPKIGPLLKVLQAGVGAAQAIPADVPRQLAREITAPKPAEGGAAGFTGLQDFWRQMQIGKESPADKKRNDLLGAIADKLPKSASFWEEMKDKLGMFE